jgi:hypothetical protein
MNKINLIISAFWLLLLTTGVMAQSGTCLDFEDLQAGDRYGSSSNFVPGNIFYEKEDITIALDSFYYPNGNSGFFNLLIEGSNDPNGPGVTLFPSNINLKFQLDALPDGEKKICFDFQYFGGDINFSLNDEQPLVFSSLEDFYSLSDTIFADIELDISPSSNDRRNGTVCIKGTDIHEVLIGGQELVIDNFCVEYREDDCQIKNLKVEPRPCTPNGIFYVDLKFEALQDSGAYFVLVNNQQFGPFLYPLDSFLTVGPIQTFGDQHFNLTVYDSEQPNCKASTRFQQTCIDYCQLDDLEVEAEVCTGDSLARIKLDFQVDVPNVANTTFKIWIDNTEFGEISLLRLPYTLEIPIELLKGDETPFTVCISPNLATGERCCVEGIIKVKKCEDTCPIEDIKAELIRCKEQGLYDIYLDVAFEHQYRDYPVAVYVDGRVVDTIRSGSFPVELTDIPVYSRALTFPVKVCPLWASNTTDHASCCKTIELDKRDCTDRCPIEAIGAEIVECLPNGNFNIRLKVDYADGYYGSAFKVWVEGEDLGIFETNPEGLLLENAPVFTDALNFEVRVCPVSLTTGAIEIYESCCKSLLLNKEDCGLEPPDENCTFFDDLVSASFSGEDYEPGTEIFSLSNISFRLFELQNLDWSTSYETLSVKSAADLPDFAAGAGQVLYLEAISSIISFADYPEAVEAVKVDFYHLDGHLNVSANGAPVQILSILSAGTYTIGNGVEVDITLGSNDSRQGTMTFKGDINALLIGGEALVLDNLCVNTREEPCEIGDLQLKPTECDENGQFYLNLDFRHKNTSDYFIVASSDNRLKRFSYDELPVKLGPFTGSISRELVIEVYDVHKENCAARTEFGPYQCEIACEIFGVSAYDIECDPNTGLYNFTLKVEGENLGPVLILGNENGFIKRFPYNGEPVLIKGIPLPDGRLDQLSLCAGLQPNDAYACCYRFEVALDCRQTCTIEYAEVFDIECLPNGTYSFSLKLDGQNIQDGTYLLKTRLGFEAKFRLDSNVARIDQVPLPETATGIEFIKICKVNADTLSNSLIDCCYELEFRVDCREECGLRNVRIFDFDCDTDSTYSVSLKIDAADYLFGEVLYVKTESGFEYRFKWEGEPVRLEGIPKFDNDNIDLLKLCAPNYPDCCLEIRYEIDCATNEPCKLGELLAEATPCESDGSFFIRLDFRHENTSDGFEVFINDRPLGGYRYEDLPIEVGPIMPNAISNGRYEVKVKDWEKDCAASTEVEACINPEGCSFAAVELITKDCQDGFFKVVAELELANKKEGGFLVFAEGELFGPFRYSQNQRIELGPFRGNGLTSYDFLFVDLNDPTCFLFQELGVVDCDQDEECEGLAFRARPLACDSNGMFNILLDVDLDLTVIYPIAIEVNGTFYDSVQIANPSFEIGPFPADSAYTITIIDGWHPECISTYDLGAVDCRTEDDSEVWPGDANRDRIANHLDLLNLGIAWGKQGPERTLPGSRWTGVPASSWGSRFSDAAESGDFKHADCNGDGIVNEEDIRVIRKNYNLRNGQVQDSPELPATDVDPPVFFEVPESAGLPDSGYFNIPIVLGSAEQPLKDIYGVAFTIEFDPQVIDPADIEITYPTSWLGEAGVNLQSITYQYQGEGKIEIAITRTDQNEVSGFGPVAMFRGIRDDIVGRSESQLDISHSYAVRTNQSFIKLNGLPKTAKFIPKSEVENYGLIDLKRGMRVYPNPTSSTINIDNFFGVPIDAVQIITTNGQVMSPRYEGVTSLDISDLPDGLYLVRVEINGYIIHQKLFKSKSW